MPGKAAKKSSGTPSHSTKALKSPKAGAVVTGESAESTIMRLLDVLSSGERTGEEGEQFVGSLVGSDLFRQLNESTRTDEQDEAQTLAFDAIEAEDEEQSLALVRQALALDPDCIDALVHLASLSVESPGEMIAALEQAVAAGERSFGAKYFAENAGEFWGLIETRPYMRARLALGELLASEGSPRKAIDHFEALLRLNPHDDQGVRDPLLSVYLRRRDVKGAQSLFSRYEHESGVVFLWGRVLERFLADDLTAARAALSSARRANGYVERYMTKQLPIPEYLPEMYSLGSSEEAVVCMDVLLEAWAANSEALMWLFDRLATPVPGRRQHRLK